MTGRIFEAGPTTAPDHMPNRAEDIACITGGNGMDPAALEEGAFGRG